MANGRQVLVAVVLAVAGGGIAAKHFYIDNPPARVAKALAETFPVHTADSAASDVAIYTHPSDPAKSLILATDRRKGIAIYDLKGSEVDFDAIGTVTDIDLRSNVKLGDREITLVAVAAGDKKDLQLFELKNEKPYLHALDGGSFHHDDIQADDVCLYRNPKTGEASVYLIGRERDVVAEAKAGLAQLKKLATLTSSESDKKSKKDEKKENKVVAPVGDVPPAPTTSNPTSEPTTTPAPAAGEKSEPAKTEGAEKSDKKKHKDGSSSESDAAKSSKKEKNAEHAKADSHAKNDKKSEKKDKKAQESTKLSPEAEKLAKIATSKDNEKKARGVFAVQMRLGVGSDNALALTESRRIKLEGKSEGSVVDDENGTLFVSEAKKGIWKFQADGGKDTVDVGTLICKVGFPNPLRPDVEGIALYRGENGAGYLVAASEGSKDFVVLKRAAPYEYVGRFKIEGNGTVDAVDDSGGLAVASGNFGGELGSGVVVLQDEKNENASGGVENQNFKIVPWSEVAKTLQP